jgi:hypothetical protein
MNTVRYPVRAEDLGREKSASLWRNSLEKYADQASGDPEIGAFYYDDFGKPRSNTTDASKDEGWFIQDAEAGGTVESFASIASPDGVARLSADTGTDHFGIEAHRGATATSVGRVNLPTHATDPRGRVVYETRVKLAASDQYFIGLTEPIVEFLSTTSTLPADSDYIGFFRSDAGVLKFVTATDNDGATAVTDEATILTAAEVDALTDYVKLGFAVNPDSSVEIFVNGVSYHVLAATINPLALPIEALTEKYATTRGATGDLDDVALDIDWVATFVARL